MIYDMTFSILPKPWYSEDKFIIIQWLFKDKIRILL